METGHASAAHLTFDAAEFRDKFDGEPFAFSHNLHRLGLFSPDGLADLTRRFDAVPGDYFLQGQTNIGQVDLHGRDPAYERVYKLRPGVGFHQPQNSPHWVRTQGSRSISYAFVYETAMTRMHNRARACNYYLRRAGLEPSEPGRHPARDVLKSATMRMLIPARSMVGSTLRSLRVRAPHRIR